METVAGLIVAIILYSLIGAVVWVIASVTFEDFSSYTREQDQAYARIIAIFWPLAPVIGAAAIIWHTARGLRSSLLVIADHWKHK